MRVEPVDPSETDDVVDPAAWLDIVPEPVVPPGPPRNRLRAALGLAGALVTHGGFAALFVLLLHWRDIDATPERAIPIEVVSQMPGGSGSGKGSGAGGQASGQEKPDQPAPDGPADKGPPDGQADKGPPDSPADKGPPDGPADKRPPDGPADKGPPEPNPQASAKPTPETTPKPAADAVQPPPDAKPKPPPPMKVAPPPEAAPAATQQTQPKAANTAPDVPKPVEQTAAPPPPPQAPQVLSSAAGDVAVPAAAPAGTQTEDKPAPSAPTQQERDNAAQLAAALPMDVSVLPPSFRAVLSGGGEVQTDNYKGVVFGKLGRSQGAEEEARAKHLRGEVVVSFSIDDKGQVVGLKVLHSSGTPAVDALALQMIKEAAPFPPPPPKSQRVFTPVLSFGDS